jgi:hypothetical protein
VSWKEHQTLCHCGVEDSRSTYLCELPFCCKPHAINLYITVQEEKAFKEITAKWPVFKSVSIFMLMELREVTRKMRAVWRLTSRNKRKWCKSRQILEPFPSILLSPPTLAKGGDGGTVPVESTRSGVDNCFYLGAQNDNFEETTSQRISCWWGNTVRNYVKGVILKKQIVAQVARILLPFSQLTVAGLYLKPD